MLKIYKVFFSILFIFIIYKLNNIQININIIEQLTIKSLIIYLLFFILSILLISTRWLIIIKDIYKITFVQSIKISLLSFSLNTATIGGSGDLFKIFLWNKKIKKEQLFNCVVVEKIFGLLAFLLLILIFTGKSIFNLSFLKLLLIIFIYFILIFFLVKNSFLVKNIPYINYYDFLLKNKILNSKKKLIVIFLLSMCIQTSFYANLFIFSFLNFKDIINIYSFFYYSLISLANAVPFFFSGFGIREFFTIFFVNYLKIDYYNYFNFILIIGLLNLFIAIIILFLRFIIKYFFFRIFYNIRKYKS